MQRYQILTLQTTDRNGQSVTWTRTDAQGFYVPNVANLPPKHINDFLSSDLNSVIKIMSVKRTTNPIVLTVGRMYHQGKIVRIIIEKNICYLLIGTLARNTRYNLEEMVDVPLPVLPDAPTLSNKQLIDLIQTKIITSYPIELRLECTKRARKETLEQFIEDFFTEHNTEKDTIFVQDTRQIQTEKGKRRSLGDIFMIIKYYYPTATLQQVLRILLVVLPGRLGGFRTSMCSIINKRVWYYNGTQETGQFDVKKKDEFGNNYEWYVSKM